MVLSPCGAESAGGAAAGGACLLGWRRGSLLNGLLRSRLLRLDLRLRLRFLGGALFFVVFPNGAPELLDRGAQVAADPADAPDAKEQNDDADDDGELQRPERTDKQRTRHNALLVPRLTPGNQSNHGT